MGVVPTFVVDTIVSAELSLCVACSCNDNEKQMPWGAEENADQSCQANSTMWPANPAAHVRPVEYYSRAYEAMLRDWRDSKGIDFPVGTVQLPPSVKSGINPAVSNPEWAGRPDIRWAQATSLAHPHGNTTESSGVAVTIE